MTTLNPYRRLIEGSKVASQTPVARPAPQVPAGVKAQPKKVASKQDEATFDGGGEFNPLSAGQTTVRDGIRQALNKTSRNRMFDKSGSLNAYDKRDALVQIAHLLQNVTREGNAAFTRQASTMPSEERRKVLASALMNDSSEGFRIVGQELLLPIKDIIDYESWGRKVLRVRHLAQGELFRIARDVRSTAWVVGQDGQAPEARVYGKYIQPDEFKIVAFPSVDIEDIMQMNYDVLDRAQDTARQEIELEEDKRIVSLLDAASSSMNTVTTFASLGVGAFEDIRYQIERHRLLCDKFLINRQELSDIVKTMSTQVDPVTERELILAGYIGSFLNSQIITSAGTGVEEVVPAGSVYAVTSPEYLGEWGIRIELFSEPYNKFAQRETVKGWIFMQMCGGVVANDRGVAKGTKA